MAARYIIMEHIGARGQHDRFVCVRDGFSFWALVLPIVWLIWHRLYLASALALALCIAFLALAAWQTMFVIPAVIMATALGFVLAFEGGHLRVEVLRLSGFKTIAIINADSQTEAELIFAHGRTGRDDTAHKPTPPPLPASVNPIVPVVSDMIFAMPARGAH